jgi:diguanylate cyclase (GGDEF)-like protein
MADIDHFKNVNDTYGHLAGDGVLKEVAARIKNSLRGFDVVGRYGGEEFLLILHKADLATARMVAERIRSRIVATPIDLPSALLDITISMGVAMAKSDEDVNSLVERADKALYNAKENGRDQVSLAE